ncbi:hypothetical protein D3C87_206550 [compost metagenome]
MDKNMIGRMHLHEVSGRADASLFLDLPNRIHSSNPQYIQPLNKDIAAVFDEKKNKFFQHGKCSRWLLFDENKTVIGRIAAFINHNYEQDQPTGGIGFFECIDNTHAANFMFDECKRWLQREGMQAMDGPINFGERVNWWGLLMEGFDAPLYGMNYHPPYYRNLFEQYGFKVYFYQDCYSMNLAQTLPEKFYRIKDKIESYDGYRVIPFCKRRLKQFALDFTSIYNKSWETHGEGKTMEENEAIKLFSEMKAVIDEKAIWFAYHHDQPIACWLNLPDLNYHFRSLKGKFSLLHILRFLWLKKFRPSPKLVGILFGVIPEYQAKGIDAFMVVSALSVLKSQTRYSHYEMQWIGDFNPKMINFAKNMGAERTRRLATYRYLFDQNQIFHRHRMLG